MTQLKNINILLIVALFCLGTVKNIAAQESIKVMYYNILNFPGSTPERVGSFRTIAQYIDADVILVNELISDEGAVILLEQGLNVFGSAKFKKAEFTNGPDSDNMMFYDSTKVSLFSQATISTELRFINEYVLFYNEIAGDTIFLHMYSAHLKSSTGSENEQKRLAEVSKFKEWVDNKPQAKNIFFGGDFNFYDSDEPAYDTLMNFGVKKLNDPLLAGNWHDNSSYANIHSQSTRTDQFGGGATGGLDDRFDFILFSDDVKFGLNGVVYIPNSCKAIGNDGSHMNGAINSAPTNTSVPDSVLQALYTMSDHLPLVCEVEITGLTQMKEMTSLDLNIDIYPNPTTRLTNVRFYGQHKKVTMILMNGLGKVILQEEIHINNNISQTELDLSGFKNGVYYLNIQGDNSFVSKKVILLK